MKKKSLIILVALACITLLASCGPMRWAHNADPTFSFTVPPSSDFDTKRTPNEVVRYGGTTNPYRLPTYYAAVFDKPAGFTLADGGKFVVNDYQKSYPDASRFKILEQKTVTLDDGSPAQAVKLKWKWTDRTTVLKSASVVAIKGDKVIHFSGTTIYAGGTSMEELMQTVLSLQLK